MIIYDITEAPLAEKLSNLASIELIENGQRTILSGQQKLSTLDNLKGLFDEARIMPAFGVSLHNETTEAMQQGSWLKLRFASTSTINELPFDSLIFRLETCQGLDLIREIDGSLNGRCIHLAFDREINLFDLIK